MESSHCRSGPIRRSPWVSRAPRAPRRARRATFLIKGWSGVHHPEAVAEIVQRGHELGMNGWAHELRAELAPNNAERAVAMVSEWTA